MKKALIICAGGMSSSLIAKKTTELLKDKGIDVFVEACGTGEGRERIKKQMYDLYLISPQTKMYFKQLEEEAKATDQAIVQIPPQAYIPIPSGIQKMSVLVEENI